MVTSDFYVARAEYVFNYVFDDRKKIIRVSATAAMSKIEKDKHSAHEKQSLAGLKKNGIIYERL